MQGHLGWLLRRATAKAFTFDRRLLARSLAASSVARSDMIRLGSDYGGWWVPEVLLDQRSVVYSVGVGEDISFDEELTAIFGCTVYGFDPTPRAQEHVRSVNPDKFILIPIALWTSRGSLRLYRQAEESHVSLSVQDRDATGLSLEAGCDTLTGFRHRLGHDHVDLLKMDIEGAEAEVMDWLVASSERPRIVMLECERREPWWRTRKRLTRFMDTGYLHVHSEGANHCFVRSEGTTLVGRHPL